MERQNEKAGHRISYMDALVLGLVNGPAVGLVNNVPKDRSGEFEKLVHPEFKSMTREQMVKALITIQLGLIGDTYKVETGARMEDVHAILAVLEPMIKEEDKCYSR